MCLWSVLAAWRQLVYYCRIFRDFLVIITHNCFELYFHSILELQSLIAILHFQLQQDVKDKQSQPQIRFNSCWRAKAVKSFIEHLRSFTTPMNVEFDPVSSIIYSTVPICSGCMFSAASKTCPKRFYICVLTVSPMSAQSWAKTVAPVKHEEKLSHVC